MNDSRKSTNPFLSSIVADSLKRTLGKDYQSYIEARVASVKSNLVAIASKLESDSLLKEMLKEPETARHVKDRIDELITRSIFNEREAFIHTLSLTLDEQEKEIKRLRRENEMVVENTIRDSNQSLSFNRVELDSLVKVSEELQETLKNARSSENKIDLDLTLNELKSLSTSLRGSVSTRCENLNRETDRLRARNEDLEQSLFESRNLIIELQTNVDEANGVISSQSKKVKSTQKALIDFQMQNDQTIKKLENKLKRCKEENTKLHNELGKTVEKNSELVHCLNDCANSMEESAVALDKEQSKRSQFVGQLFKFAFNSNANANSSSNFYSLKINLRKLRSYYRDEIASLWRNCRDMMKKMGSIYAKQLEAKETELHQMRALYSQSTKAFNEKREEEYKQLIASLQNALTLAEQKSQEIMFENTELQISASLRFDREKELEYLRKQYNSLQSECEVKGLELIEANERVRTLEAKLIQYTERTRRYLSLAEEKDAELCKLGQSIEKAAMLQNARFYSQTQPKASTSTLGSSQKRDMKSQSLRGTPKKQRKRNYSDDSL